VLAGEETGCRAVIADLAGKRGHKFTEDYAMAGVEGLDLHHLYRAMAWLGEELSEKEQDGRTPFSPRCVA
jgi:hypothetical protein